MAFPAPLPAASPKGATERLAEYAASLTYSAIPTDVVEHVKRMTVNILAASLWGTHTPGGHQTQEVLVALGGPGQATVFGTDLRLPAPYAAAVHAARAFMTMTDDTHPRAQIHSGHATVLPALAVCEVLGLTGADYITAVVAANEVAIRIAHSVGPEQSQTFNTFRGGFWGELKCTFAAAVAAGRAAGVDADVMTRAMGIAATSSSGLLSTGYGLPPQTTACGSAIAWEAGKAVLLGMLAVDLAKAGMSVAPEPLEGSQGWVRTYTRGHGSVESLTDGLGVRFDTLDIALKAHCMSHTSFGLVEAAAEIASRERLSVDDIDTVTLVGPSYLPDFLWRTEITSFADAVCSTPFAVAMALLEPGSMTLPDQVWRRVHDDEMAALLRRFVFEADESIPVNAGPLAGAVRVAMSDGRVFDVAAPAACLGTYPDRPFAEGDLARKFRQGAEGLLVDGSGEAVFDAILDMENGDVLGIARLLSRAGSEAPEIWS